MTSSRADSGRNLTDPLGITTPTQRVVTTKPCYLIASITEGGELVAPFPQCYAYQSIQLSNRTAIRSKVFQIACGAGFEDLCYESTGVYFMLEK